MSMHSGKVNKTRVSTAKSSVSQYSTFSKAEMYIAEKKAGKVVEDDTLSVAENNMIDRINMQEK